MTSSMILVAGMLVIGLYLILSNRLISLMHPLKMRLVSLGQKLLADPDLPKGVADNIDRSLDRAYSTSRAWLYVALMPVGMSVAVWHQIIGKKDDSLQSVPARLREEVRIFCILSLLTTVANSPLAIAFFAVQLLIYLILFFPVGAALREILHVSDTIESRSASVLAHHHFVG